MKNIAVISPYHGDSHHQWYESLAKLKYSFDAYTLGAKYWKWRMQAGAIELASQVNISKKEYDFFLCTDMLNLALFKSLLLPKYQNIPIVLYMHENQLTYPWSSLDHEKKGSYDQSYVFINFTSMIIANRIWFNSHFHRNELLETLPKFLKVFPRNNLENYIVEIENKSSVLYPILASKIAKEIFQRRSNKPKNRKVLLWNHRWQHDKQPQLFYELLVYLEKKQFDFGLILLGQSHNNQINHVILQEFKKNIIYAGYVQSKNEYYELLTQADILPVCSIHEFFGYSVLEAVQYGVLPILPQRLSYPEIFDQALLKQLFYTSETELYEKVAFFLNRNIHIGNIKDCLSSVVNKYDIHSLENNYYTAFSRVNK